MNQTHASQFIAARAHPSSASGPFHSDSQPRIAFVRAGWHADIVGQAERGFAAEYGRLWPSAPPFIDLHKVPGAFEIPLLAQALAQRGNVQAIVACALVVDGGIYRHDFVAHAVIDGLMRVQLDTEVPVMSAVLTPRDFHDHEDHVRFFREHFVKKGTEVAQACLQTMAYLRKLASPTLANAQHGAPLAEAV